MVSLKCKVPCFPVGILFLLLKYLEQKYYRNWSLVHTGSCKINVIVIDTIDFKEAALSFTGFSDSLPAGSYRYEVTGGQMKGYFDPFCDFNLKHLMNMPYFFSSQSHFRCHLSLYLLTKNFDVL